MENVVPKATDQLQFVFWTTDDPRLTNYVALYDLAPRQVTTTERPESTPYLKAVKKTFKFGDCQYSLLLRPARMVNADGHEFDKFPGEREQLVEDTIRSLSIRPGRLMLAGQGEIRTTFSIYAVQRELMRYGHTFSHDEIKEAIRVLHLSVIEITPIDENRKTKPVLSASAFPALAFKDENSDVAESFVQFNPLVEQALKRMRYDQVNFEWMMTINGHLPRWVFKNLSIMVVSGQLRDPNIVVTSAAELISCNGLSRSRWRDALSTMDEAIEAMVANEVIECVERREEKQGRKKIDIHYVLRLSPRFVRDRETARENSRFIRDTAARHVDAEDPREVCPISKQDAAHLRYDRQKALARDLIQ